MPEYQTTKEQCQQEIDATGHVCKYCGGKLEPIDTVDNARNPTFWIGCMTCERFGHGCSPETFKTAKRLVEECGFYYYKSDNSASDEYNKKCNIAKAAEVIEDIERLKQSSV